jgi:hypothetical protein
LLLDRLALVEQVHVRVVPAFLPRLLRVDRAPGLVAVRAVGELASAPLERVSNLMTRAFARTRRRVGVEFRGASDGVERRRGVS